MATDSAYRREQHISTDRETIRRWADRHNAVPVQGVSDGTLDLVHEARVGPEHERIGWDTFYEELDSGTHAVSYRVDGLETPEVMTQEQAVSRRDTEDKQIRDRLVAGETVSNTIKETSPVETPVTGEATVTSQLINREVISENLLNVDLVERTCTDFAIVSHDDFVDADTFDRDRYFASLRASRNENTQPDSVSSLEASLPYTAKDNYQARMDIKEAWIPSREVTERFTVESHVTETGVAEAQTLDEYDIDVTELQRSIIEQGILGVEHDADEPMRDFEIESELGEGNRIHTYFTRTSVIEDEVVNQIRAYADFNRADFAEMDFTASNHVVSNEASGTTRSNVDGISFTDEDIGKDILDATGNDVGTVEDITDGGQTVSVEPHSSITESITSALGGSDEDEREMEVYAGQVAEVTHDELRLKDYEQLAENRRATIRD